MVATKRSRAGDSLTVVLTRLRSARKDAGITQSEMGKYLGLSRSGYGHLESGNRLVTVEDLFQFSRILNRPVEWFLGLDTDLTEDEGRVLMLYQRAKEMGLDDNFLRLVKAFVGEG